MTNCCDDYGNCNQGRDCPIRHSKVARVGRKDHDKAALPRSPWPVYMKHLAKWMLICVAVLFAAAIIAGVANA